MDYNSGFKKREATPSDYLANERTFLAWVRSALGVAAFGFVVIKFSLFFTHINLLLSDLSASDSFPSDNYYKTTQYSGISMIAFAGVMLIISYVRYHNIYRDLEKGEFKTRSFTLLFMVLILIFFMILVLGTFIW